MFCYEDAESVVGQFARKSAKPEEAWRAIHGKLYEYIEGTQREADWDAKRLQLAIAGALTTRILHLPTNAIVSVVAAYGPEIPGLRDVTPPGWSRKSTARKQLQSTPLARLLKGEGVSVAKRGGGPAKQALEQAVEPFQMISSWVSATGEGSDKLVNASLAKALAGSLGQDEATIATEQYHPWIPQIIPDLRVDPDDTRHICIEMCYTTKSDLYVVADYVMKKLDRYMAQIDLYVQRSSGS